MNIGIIGPPGSGKSKLAREIKDKVFNNDVTVKIVDNYAQKLQRDTGLALGPWASFNESFMIAGVRQAIETKERKNHTHTLTVGTILDTVMYCGIHSQEMIYGAWDEIADITDYWINIAMPAIGVWYEETWDYDVAIVCSTTDSSPGWKQDFSQEMPGLVASFGTPNVLERNKNTFDIIAEKLKTPVER